jgi:hypothetical protein
MSRKCERCGDMAKIDRYRRKSDGIICVECLGYVVLDNRTNSKVTGDPSEYKKDGEQIPIKEEVPPKSER